jgi:hypothetical protein
MPIEKHMTEVYTLRKDVGRVARVQKASLGSEGFGYEQTHGVFGSPEWWQRIDSGELATQTISGIITRTYMGSMGDWPECQVTSDAGEISTWTREAQDRALAQLYRVGAHIEIRFVMQTFRHAPSSIAIYSTHKPNDNPNDNKEHRCVLSISIEDVA